MNVILVDTSVWINVFRGRATQSSLLLKNSIDKFIIATCPVIVQETLQGVLLEKEYNHLYNYFTELRHLGGDPYHLAIEAAQLYRKLRKIGISIRKPNDCLIAVYALHHKIKLLHDDKDFIFIAGNSALELVH